jgi:hypothetical protein
VWVVAQFGSHRRRIDKPDLPDISRMDGISGTGAIRLDEKIYPGAGTYLVERRHSLHEISSAAPVIIPLKLASTVGRPLGRQVVCGRHNMKVRLVLFLMIAQACLAENPFIIGVRGGVPLNDVVNTVQNGSSISSSTDNYVVGPTVGIRLPLGLSIAGDALFTRLTLSANSSGAATPGAASTATSFSASASSWEFPVLVRLRIGHAGIAPFVGAGISVRHLSDFGNVGPFLTNSSGNPTVNSSTGVGFALAGGIDFKIKVLHVSPEIRYTHWGSNQISNAFNNVIRTNSNEGQILVGLTF